MLDFLIHYSGIITAIIAWVFFMVHIFFNIFKKNLWTETISESTTNNIRLSFVFSMFLLVGGFTQMLFAIFLFEKGSNLTYLPYVLFGFLGLVAMSGAYITKKRFLKIHYAISLIYFVLLPLSIFYLGLSIPGIFGISLFFASLYCIGCPYFLYKNHIGTYFEFFVFGVLGTWAIIVNLLLI